MSHVFTHRSYMNSFLILCLLLGPLLWGLPHIQGFPPLGVVFHKAVICEALFVPPVSLAPQKTSPLAFFHRYFSMALRPGPWGQASVQYFPILLICPISGLVLASSHPVIHPTYLEGSASGVQTNVNLRLGLTLLYQ